MTSFSIGIFNVGIPEDDPCLSLAPICGLDLVTLGNS